VPTAELRAERLSDGAEFAETLNECHRVAKNQTQDEKAAARRILAMAFTISEPQILFICGSPQQAEELHRVAVELGDCRVWFTPYYGGLTLTVLRELGLLERTVAGKGPGERCLAYLRSQHLPIDLDGRRGRYDLIVSTSDLPLPPNAHGQRVVVVGSSSRERTVAAERLVWRVAQRMSSWLTTDPAEVDCRICVVGDDDREFFLDLGVPRHRIVVTGLADEVDLGPAAATHGSAAKRIARVCRELIGCSDQRRSDSGLDWRPRRAA
jgi:hypothetical protein